LPRDVEGASGSAVGAVSGAQCVENIDYGQFNSPAFRRRGFGGLLIDSSRVAVCQSAIDERKGVVVAVLQLSDLIYAKRLCRIMGWRYSADINWSRARLARCIDIGWSQVAVFRAVQS
jgi:hypothetical protein